MKTTNFLTNECFEWTYEEDAFLIEKMQDKKYFYKWVKIARHINKNFPLSKHQKNGKQVKRRWLNTLFPILRNQWNKTQALYFIQMINLHDPQSKKTWQLIKTEFPQYSFKMLKYKYKQLLTLQQQKFIQLHCQKQNNVEVCPLSILCRQLMKI